MLSQAFSDKFTNKSKLDVQADLDSSQNAIVINENTKLLDVLTEEFNNEGKTAGEDINGFREINGLVLTK